jgi:predicted house-cleaning noncanonical NTP pyrophosphatase (MazG superfamily)
LIKCKNLTAVLEQKLANETSELVNQNKLLEADLEKLLAKITALESANSDIRKEKRSPRKQTMP